MLTKMDKLRITYLLKGYVQNSLLPAEQTELLEILQYCKDDPALVQLMVDIVSQLEHIAPSDKIPSGQIWETIIQDPHYRQQNLKPYAFSRLRPWNYYGAAVVAGVVLLLVMYFYPDKPPIPQIADTNLHTIDDIISHVVEPGKQQATLTLPDGHIIALDSLTEGKVM